MLLKDQKLQSKLNKDGFIVIDLLKLSEIEKLKDIYSKYPLKMSGDFHVSNFEKNFEKNQLIDQEIKKVISPKLSLFFKDYKPLNAFFYVKNPTKDSAFYIHKDWCIVDESKYESINIWIPLTPTHEKNGNLFFCPFEYKLNLKTYRGSPGFEYPESNKLTRWINNRYQKNIYTKPGEAVCFKHLIMHGSKTNESEEARVVVGISIVNKDAQLIHYHKNNEDGKIYEIEIDEDFFINFDFNNIPDKYSKRKELNI